MLTEDEALKLFARADPARADDNSSDVDVSRALDDLRRRNTAPTVVEITPTTDTPRNGYHWRIMTAAAAAAVVLVAGALLLVAGNKTTDPASSDISVAPSVAPAPPPQQDPAEEFAQWAERMGTPVIRPACYTAAGTTASALTCYGLIRNDEGSGFDSVLVATAVLGDPGIDTFTRVSIGEQSDGAAPPATTT